MGNLSFGTYDEEEASKEKEELQKGGNEFAKLKVGRNVFRILPPAPGRRSPFRVVFQHFIEMPGGSKSVICARLESRKPCVVCAHVERLKKSQSHEDQKIADDLFARRRVFVNVIDRSDEEKGPKVLAVGKQVHEQLVALRDPEVHRHAAKVDVVLDGNPDQNALDPQRISVRLADGTEHAIVLPHVYGHPAVPLSAAENEAKFRRCCGNGRIVLPGERVEALVAAVGGLDGIEDVAGLVRLTLGEG